MKRRHHGFGLRAVVVESIGAMFLLYLLFSDGEVPVAAAPDSPAVQVPGSTAIDTACPLPAASRVSSDRHEGDIPMLSLPAPPRQIRDGIAEQGQDELESDRQARRAFVAKELDHSREVLVSLVKRHLHSIVESP